MELSRDDVLRVAKLARLDLSEEQVERYQSQLSDILGNFAVLSEVDTENVEPTAQPFDTQNIMREDITKPSLDCTDVMLNAPSCECNNFKVKPVME